MGVAIRTVDLSKAYKRSRRATGSLRDLIAERARPNQWFGKQPRDNELVWAVRDVNLEVEEHSVLGLIGRNGAGKSTLLKVLSRITAPTTGWAEVFGRVGSLLEVGTGFHPDLSGRDNLRVAAAILGMGSEEVRRKQADIVEFAGVEAAIDQPVKRYSSGMQTRLAFSIAAHLEPEILLVDEVLAVGDLEFQRRCLGKLDEASQRGRTVVFVSHQMNQVRSLCTRTLWLDNGGVREDGDTAEVLAHYEVAMLARQSGVDRVISESGFQRWWLADHPDPHSLATQGNVECAFELVLTEPIEDGVIGIVLTDNSGVRIWATERRRQTLRTGSWTVVVKFPLMPLRSGVYWWRIALADGPHVVIDDWHATPPMVVDVDNFQSSDDRYCGVMNLFHELDVEGPA